jgi:hypothetical protein
MTTSRSKVAAMSEKKVSVPDVISKRVHSLLRRMEGYPHPDGAESGKLLVMAVALCEEFARGLEQNPIVPTPRGSLRVAAPHVPCRPEIPGTEREIINEWLKRHQSNGSRVSLVGDSMAEELVRELETLRQRKGQ